MDLSFNSDGDRRGSGVPGISGKIAVPIFFAIFLIVGAALLVAFGWMVANDARPWFWRPTDCTILESSADDRLDRAGRRDAFVFTVRYAYEFDGISRTSDRFTSQDKRFQFVNDAERLVEKYRDDTRARCWVNPAAPADAVLERQPLWMAIALLFPLVFVAIGAVGLVAVFRGKLFRQDTAQARANTGIPRLIFGGFLLLGTGTFCGFFVQPATRIFAARSWPEVPCRVISSSVQVDDRGNDDPTFRADVLYAYTIGSREFRSNRHGFLGGSSSGSKGKSAIVRQFPRGKNTVCFVNPDDPTEAVLDRGLQTEMWFGLIPLVFVIVGALGVICARRGHPGKT